VLAGVAVATFRKSTPDSLPDSWVYARTWRVFEQNAEIPCGCVPGGRL